MRKNSRISLDAEAERSGLDSVPKHDRQYSQHDR
jgi:hypothetical protein